MVHAGREHHRRDDNKHPERLVLKQYFRSLPAVFVVPVFLWEDETSEARPWEAMRCRNSPTNDHDGTHVPQRTRHAGTVERVQGCRSSGPMGGRTQREGRRDEPKERGRHANPCRRRSHRSIRSTAPQAEGFLGGGERLRFVCGLLHQVQNNYYLPEYGPVDQ